MPPPEQVMQQIAMVIRGWKPLRMPCCVPATANDASPMVSIVCDSQPSIPVPMAERRATRDKTGQNTKVTRAVATHIPRYSVWEKR